MFLVQSALKDYDVSSLDGTIGRLTDCLFGDRTWTVRWFVIDVGHWLTER